MDMTVITLLGIRCQGIPVAVFPAGSQPIHRRQNKEVLIGIYLSDKRGRPQNTPHASAKGFVMQFRAELPPTV